MGIDWTVYGKVKSVAKINDKVIEFFYDAAGNRIRKKVTPISPDASEENTFYVRDASGNVMATYTKSNAEITSSTDFRLNEQYIYGSSRVGLFVPDKTLATRTTITDFDPNSITHTTGLKQYELSNHLGNVLTTVSDRRTGVDVGSNNTIDYFTANVTSVTDYGVWGDQLPGRNASSNVYKYGFNGKEKDDEWKTNGNSYDYGMRMYDPRLGRFMSIDMFADKYASWTPYNYSFNNPTSIIDVDGNFPGLPSKNDVANFITSAAELANTLYRQSAKYGKEYPSLVNYANTAIDVSRKAASMTTDLNPESMGWADLTSVWLFELGNYKNNTINFGPTAKTTQDLKLQEGVLNARNRAMSEIKEGDLSQVNEQFKYGQKEFYEGVKNNNVVTSFLGSYDITVEKVNNSDGSYTLNYTVKNTTGWESGTRLRKDNDKNGQHDAVIPDKNRGEGINLGGNISEVWKWSETIPAKKAEVAADKEAAAPATQNAQQPQQ